MRTLSRKKSHRESMLRNLLTSLFLYESLETTEAKAKDLKVLCDRTITRAKNADLDAIKYLNSILLDGNACKKVIKEILPRFSDRKSGFTKLYKTGYRIGDNAPTVRIELVDKKVFVEKKTSQTKVKPNKKADSAKDKKETDNLSREDK